MLSKNLILQFEFDENRIQLKQEDIQKDIKEAIEHYSKEQSITFIPDTFAFIGSIESKGYVSLFVENENTKEDLIKIIGERVEWMDSKSLKEQNQKISWRCIEVDEHSDAPDDLSIEHINTWNEHRMMKIFKSNNQLDDDIDYMKRVEGLSFLPQHAIIYGISCKNCCRHVKERLEKIGGRDIHIVHLKDVPESIQKTYIKEKTYKFVQVSWQQPIEKPLRPDELKECIERDSRNKIVSSHCPSMDTTMIHFFIKGISCKNCIKRIKQLLNEQFGLNNTHELIEFQLNLDGHGRMILQSDLLLSEIKTIMKQTINSDRYQIHFENPPLLPLKDRPEPDTTVTPPTAPEEAPLYSDIESEGMVIEPYTETFKASYIIRNMTCASCVSKIENSIRSKSGVTSFNVNLVSQKGVLQFTSLLEGGSSSVCEMIDSMGYPCTLLSSTQHEQDDITKVSFLSTDTHLDIEYVNEQLATLSMASTASAEFVEMMHESVKKQKLLKISVDYASDTKLRLLYDELLELLELSDLELVNEEAMALKQSLLRRQEIYYYKWAFLVSLALTLPAMFLGAILGNIPVVKDYVNYPIGSVHMLTPKTIILFLLVTPVQMGCGLPFYKQAFKSLSHLTPDMNVLITIAAWTAYLQAIICVIYGVIVPHFKVPNYMETSAALITFLLLGRYLENKAKSKTSTVLIQLMNMAPEHAQLDVENDDNPRLIPTYLLDKDDVVIVRTGDKVPSDGIIIEGQADINEAMLTGESVPVSKTLGANVIGGTLVEDGFIRVRITAVGSESVLSKIGSLVEQAQNDKPKIAALADQISRYFVPCIIVIASLVFILWAILGYTVIPSNCTGHEGMVGNASCWFPQGLNGITLALLFGTSTVVIACPCALGLATPLAVMVGTGIGASHGILIKSGSILEVAQSATAICFDKTGTLTKGELDVVRVHESTTDLLDVYSLLHKIEKMSNHPIARACVSYIEEHHDVQDVPEVHTYKNISGRGVTCIFKDQQVLVGNASLLFDHNVSPLDSVSKDSPNTLVYVSVDGVCKLCLELKDTVKEDALALVSTLQEKFNLDVHMLTGDHAPVALAIGEELGIPKECIHASLTPADKAEEIQRIRSNSLPSSSFFQKLFCRSVKRHVVLYVGDGINDSPALASADVGLAVAEGTEIAMESADIVLMRDNLEGILLAIDLSRATYRRVLSNLIWAFGYNLIAVPLAGGLLFPFFHFVFPAWIAGVAMVISSISVTLNSIFLRVFYRPPSFHRPSSSPIESYSSLN
mmetsp:Transcript_12083/g.17976  ORF Transcript_12083/g.17976 Transcript_12083/m.17976 type:complete len:1269 (-) Transcript_12083:50-3856(-)